MRPLNNKPIFTYVDEITSEFVDVFYGVWGNSFGESSPSRLMASTTGDTCRFDNYEDAVKFAETIILNNLVDGYGMNGNSYHIAKTRVLKHRKVSNG